MSQYDYNFRFIFEQRGTSCHFLLNTIEIWSNALSCIKPSPVSKGQAVQSVRQFCYMLHAPTYQQLIRSGRTSLLKGVKACDCHDRPSEKMVVPCLRHHLSMDRTLLSMNYRHLQVCMNKYCILTPRCLSDLDVDNIIFFKHVCFGGLS